MRFVRPPSSSAAPFAPPSAAAKRPASRSSRALASCASPCESPSLETPALARVRERLVAEGERGGDVGAHGVERLGGVLGRRVELGRQRVEVGQRAELHDSRECGRHLRASLRELGRGSHVAEGSRSSAATARRRAHRARRASTARGPRGGRRTRTCGRLPRAARRRRMAPAPADARASRAAETRAFKSGVCERRVQLPARVAQRRRVLHEPQRRIAGGLGCSRAALASTRRERARRADAQAAPPTPACRTANFGPLQRRGGALDRLLERAADPLARARRTRSPRGRSQFLAGRARSPRSRRAGGSRRPGRPVRSRRPPAARAPGPPRPCPR